MNYKNFFNEIVLYVSFYILFLKVENKKFYNCFVNWLKYYLKGGGGELIMAQTLI